jgi:hypothetical protein
LGQFQHGHQVADTQLPFSLKQQNDAQPDRVGKGFDGFGQMIHGAVIKQLSSPVKISGYNPVSRQLQKL